MTDTQMNNEQLMIDTILVRRLVTTNIANHQKKAYNKEEIHLQRHQGIG